MEIQIESKALGEIWKALNSEYQPGKPYGKRSAHLDVLREGWGLSCEIGDILWETDDRADQLMRRDGILDFLARSTRDVRYVTRFRNPGSRNDQAIGHDAMNVHDIAALVMEVERLGFTVDAQPLVDALRPDLVRKKYITNSELSILWYAKLRHRYQPIILGVKGESADKYRTIETHSGYKATALLNGDSPVALRVDAPKCKRKTPLKNWIQVELGHNRNADLGIRLGIR